jgi:acyl-[acyl carrier protein]--UDP-N-acetylglucosamine O-acyltransferase
VRIDDRVITGGDVSIHQFCPRRARGDAFGTVGLGFDSPPSSCSPQATSPVRSTSSASPQRHALGRHDTVKWVYRTMYRSGIHAQEALDSLRERTDHPLVREYIEFIETSKRGICPAHGKKIRGTA